MSVAEERTFWLQYVCAISNLGCEAMDATNIRAAALLGNAASHNAQSVINMSVVWRYLYPNLPDKIKGAINNM